MTNLPATARILIVRLSAIGDVVHGLPVLNALREALPSAFLAWVVEGRTADLLRGHRSLDELINPPRGWYKSPGTVLSLRRKLRAMKFDVAMDVQGLTKSAALAWLSGARRRIGFDGADGRELSRWLNNELVLPCRTHIVERNLELLRALDIEQPNVHFGLEDEPVDAAFARDTIERHRLGGRFAVINPGAGWRSKLWPTERFAAVARHLGAFRGVASLVVWAGNEEQTWAGEIVAGSGGHAQLAPATSLKQLAAISRQAALFVASDTGPLHLAAALGTPCVGLYGPVLAERNGPYGAGNVAVQKMRLAGSSRERRTAGPESMAAISALHVNAACDAILTQQGLTRRSA